MCDFTTVAILLTTAMTAITVAAVLIGSAILTNAAFFTAGGSVPLMIAAAISSAAAAATLYATMATVGDFYNCALALNPAVASCIGKLDNFRNALNGIATTLAIQSIACGATAGIAWIPWAGAVPMGTILASLLVQAGLMPYLTSAFNDLRDCINSATRMELIPGWLLFVLIVATVVVEVVAIIAAVKGLPKLPPFRASRG